MPKFYLQPIFGIGNRLSMICSAVRYCNKIGYELVIVWKKELTPFSENIHFHSNFSEIFESRIKEIKNKPYGEIVYIPKSEINERTIFDPDKFNGRDVFVDDWTHFILFPEDIVLPSDDLTVELSQCLRSIIQPTRILSDYIKIIDYSCPTLQLYDLGIHIRKGAHIGLNDVSSQKKFNIPDAIILGTLEQLLNKRPEIKSVFICGQDYNTIELISKMLINRGITCNYRKIDDFKSVDSSISDTLNMAADFLALTNCSLILSSENSTFGAIASLANRSNRLILTEDDNLIEINSNVFSGSGL
jgi:hypothetical protein